MICHAITRLSVPIRTKVGAGLYPKRPDLQPIEPGTAQRFLGIQTGIIAIRIGHSLSSENFFVILRTSEPLLVNWLEVRRKIGALPASAKGKIMNPRARYVAVCLDVVWFLIVTLPLSLAQSGANPQPVFSRSDFAVSGNLRDMSSVPSGGTSSIRVHPIPVPAGASTTSTDFASLQSGLTTTSAATAQLSFDGLGVGSPYTPVTEP